MDTLARVRNALDQLVSGLGLAEEEPQAVFDPQLLICAAELEDGVCRAFPLPLVQRVVGTRLALTALVSESSPESYARVLNSLLLLCQDMASELARLPEGRVWHLCRQFHHVARHLASPASAENQSFRRMPEMLYTSSWLQQEVGRQLTSSGLSLPPHLRGKEFRRTQTQKWFDAVNLTPAGALAARLDSLRGAIESRARQIWYVLRSPEPDAALPSIYTWAHEDLFPHHHAGMSPARLTSFTASLRARMLSLGMPDIAQGLESAEWISQYALEYLMPPAPNEWAVEQSSHLTRVLHGRLARWYFFPYCHRIEPLDMVASVLRTGRPLFYERAVAHAILEYSLLQSVTVARAGAASYLGILAALERDFVTWFDGYLLRQMSYPQLRAPEGWCQYLSGLTALHFRNAAGIDGLDRFRQDFLAGRGLRSSIEILYQATQSDGPVN